MAEIECRADKFSGNRLTHIHETKCRKASKTSRKPVQNGSHPPRASFVQPTDQVEDYQALC